MSNGHSVVSDFLRPHGLQPSRILCLWNSQRLEWATLPFPYYMLDTVLKSILVVVAG